MTSPHSAYEAAGLEWLYTPPAYGRTGRGLAESNFAKERRDWVAILLREVLQNGLDARVSVDRPVEVRINPVTLGESDADFLRKLLPENHRARFAASVPRQDDQRIDYTNFLVIEDFGTTGLTGSTDQPEVDGKGQNWNAFWYREGEGGKENSAGNGGAGQGKITYFSTSGIRTIFTYTVRTDDGRGLLFGASSFKRDYEFNGNGKKWLRDAYWGLKQQQGGIEISVPSPDSALIQDFREKLGVSRQPGQYGLSLIIPAAQRFDLEEAIQIVIAEFFAPIVRGDLVVQLGGTRLDANTVVDLANVKLSDQRARALHTCTTRGYRDFYKQALALSGRDEVVKLEGLNSVAGLSELTFAPTVLEQLRTILDKEEAIAVRFPVIVKPRLGSPIASHFDVHLMLSQDLEYVEQAVLRRDLLIGEEPWGGGSLRQHARGLTLIAHPELSKLLLSAEEPTHLRWNTRLPRLEENYKSGREVVSYVRNAMAKLLEVLTGGERQRDFRLLAKYFAAPGKTAHTQPKGKKSEKGKGLSDLKPIPLPLPKKMMLTPLVDGCKVVPSKSLPFEATNLPVVAEIEFAYEGLDKDAFAEYDPLDFDLQDTSFNIKAINCAVVSRMLNRIEFKVTAADFELIATGFDRNLRLRIRLNYKEAENATLVDA